MELQVDLQNRDQRQREIVPPQQLATCRCTVIGVGAVGRQVALQLAAVGVPSLQLVDFDIVEVANLAPQGFLEEDLGQSKVEVTAQMCRRLNRKVQIHLVSDLYRRSLQVGNVVFACVDSIGIRRLIWEGVRDDVSLLVDGRMAAEVVRVLAACDEQSRQHYPTTLFAAPDAYVGPCTAKSTIFSANICAGLMVSRLARWLRRLPVEPDVTINLLADELSLGVG